MSKRSTPFFDVNAWRERMDGRWFDSGVAMAEKGDVDLVAIEDDLLTAHVTGSIGDIYIVQLRAPDGEGTCTCPGFEKFGGCKHQAAAVTAANAADRGQVQNRMARLREGLELDNRESLINKIIDTAKGNPSFLAKLESEDVFSPNSGDDNWWSYLFNPIVEDSLAPLEYGISTPSSDLEAKGEVEKRIAALEAAIAELRGGGIGHNNPPEDIAESPPLSDKQLDQVSDLAIALKNELQSDDPNGVAIADSGKRLRDIGKLLVDKLGLATDEAFKTSGKLIGAAAITAAGVTSVNGWKWLASCLSALVRSIVIWASS